MSTPPEQSQIKLLAFEVTIDDISCVTFAKSVKAARCNAVLAAREAGYYRSGTWPSAHVRRRESLDRHPLNDGAEPRKIWGVQYIENYP